MAYSTIDKPNKYFNTVLYTGDGTSTRNITGVGFQPDFVWFKQRSSTQPPTIIDSVRTGVGKLRTSSTSAELTGQSYNFNSDGWGFTALDAESNANTATYVAWNWLGANTTVSNTSGTITSTVSANTTSGFSIVSYTGTGANATVGHGLGVAPKMIFFKRRNTTANWNVYNSTIGATNKLNLNLTDASSASGDFNNTEPTSSVFSVATAGEVNASSSTYIAYCFAEVKGFSKFSSYTGNNTNDGPFVYTGFKPAFILIKPSNGAYNWTIIDNKRNTYNVTTLGLIPNSTSADTTGAGSTYNMDILSNGFKPRYSSIELNGSLTYIYMAFAENPFVSSKGIPTTAR